jgi:hypothetical protein
MKPQLLNFLLFLPIITFAQDSTFPDVKGDKESFSKLNDRNIKLELAQFTSAGSNENPKITSLIEVPLGKYGANYSIFQKDSVLFKIEKSKFSKANHKIKYFQQYALTIDNKPIWGKDGDLPKEQIRSVFVTIGSDTILIPQSAFSDLYEPSLTWKEGKETVGLLRVYASRDRRRYYIYMENGDGAGFYEATLIIRNKKYLRRVIDYGF